jgi:taurine--2-oxoglutarate transaminase
MAVLDVMEEERLVERSAAMGEVLTGRLAALAAAHPSVRTHRNIGLFGIVELARDRAGSPLCGYNETHPASGRLAAFFRERGLYTLVQGSSLMCNPPLCISEEELDYGLRIVDEGLSLLDRELFGAEP